MWQTKLQEKNSYAARKSDKENGLDAYVWGTREQRQTIRNYKA